MWSKDSTPYSIILKLFYVITLKAVLVLNKRFTLGGGDSNSIGKIRNIMWQSLLSQMIMLFPINYLTNNLKHNGFGIITIPMHTFNLMYI